jgi:D-sedoheptulose 7-phosphate isomerase
MENTKCEGVLSLGGFDYDHDYDNDNAFLDRAPWILTAALGKTELNRIDRHIEDHLATIAALRSQIHLIEQIGRLMIACIREGGCIFWLGNGGSAADSQHLAAELVERFELERPGIRSVALTTDTSALTAIGNDEGFERIFARQLMALCRPGDLVIGISTSGNSPNVLAAVRTARDLGLGTVGLSGRDGGELKALVDLCLIVPSDNTARIQEAHILVGHILCDLAERHVAATG